MHAALALLALMATGPASPGMTATAPLARAAFVSDTPVRTRAPAGTAAAVITTCKVKAEALMENLAAGKADAATENFAQALRRRLNIKGLVSLWGDLGEPRPPHTWQAREINDTVVAAAPLHFPAGNFVARLSCGADGKFTDFRLIPFSAPSPAAPASFRETEITVGRPPMLLGATLTVPNGTGPFPAVVLVSGAGTHDRDEAFGASKPLRDIALGLATRGIASLRYDKPAFDHPLAFIDRPYTLDDEYTEPAVEAVRRLRKTARIDPGQVFLLGHSQGGEMAPRIAQREPAVAGLILVAAPAKSLSQYFHTVEQSARRLILLYPQYASQIRKNVATTEATQQWLAQATSEDPAALAPDGAPASYWFSLRDYKSQMLAVAKTLRQPMLILQGDRDDSVSPIDDFGVWRRTFAHDPRVTLKEYPTLSHLMTPVSGSRQPVSSEKPSHVDPQVIEDIANWLLAQKPAHDTRAVN